MLLDRRPVPSVGLVLQSSCRGMAAAAHPGNTEQCRTRLKRGLEPFMRGGEAEGLVRPAHGCGAAEVVESGGNVPDLRLGERAFEIVLVRRMRDAGLQTQWFARHRSVPMRMPT